VKQAGALSHFVLVYPLPMCAAAARRTLNVTQVGNYAEPVGQTYKGNCVKDVCWATLPVQVGGDLCVLDLRAAVPGKQGWGKILLAVGPCRSGGKLAISDCAGSTSYRLDEFRATRLTIKVPFRLATSELDANCVNDGVVLTDAALRVDIVASSSH
jgi:hypothetical protein